MVTSGPALMGLDPKVHQGYFAEGFVAAIAAAAGLDVAFPRLGHRVDFSVYRPGPNGTSGSKQIDLQVKSWSAGKVSGDGYFHYPLQVSAYNFLASDKHDVRHYLILCLVPSTSIEYVDASHDRVQMCRAAYWFSLRNEQPDESLNPDSTKIIKVPQSHLLTPDTIRALVDGKESVAII